MAPAKIIVPPHHLPIAAAAAPKHLTYNGGTLLTSVQVYTIFWGAAWQQAPQSGQLAHVNQFFDSILTSSLIELLAEYSVPGRAIGHGQRIGSTTIVSAVPGQIADAQIQQALRNWIQNGTISQPNANTLYFVYLPPNVTVIDPTGNQSCNQMCGYHWFLSGTNPEVYYAVMPYPCLAGCVDPTLPPNTQQTSALTSVSSHELCEAITDPHPANGWYDAPNNGEVGDLCSWQLDTLNGFSVQKEWSNAQNACVIAPGLSWHDADLSAITTARQAMPNSAIVGYTWGGFKQVVYLGNDRDVHELCCSPPNNAWTHADLSANAGGPQPDANSALSAYTWGGFKQVVYLGYDHHIHELCCSPPNNVWTHADLSAATNATAAVAGSSVAGYTWAGRKQVVYCDNNGHIHELFCSAPNNAWTHADLSAITDAPPALAGGAIAGYSWGSFKQVVYLGTDRHIHELCCSPPNNAWTHADLSAITGGPVAATGTSLSGYTWGGFKQVVYVTGNNDVHELCCSPPNNAWTDADLSAITGATPAIGNSPGYVWGQFKQVAYLGNDQHIHELLCSPPNNAWTHGDLTARAGASSASGGSAIAGYSWGPFKQVVYFDANGHVHELCYP